MIISRLLFTLSFLFVFTQVAHSGGGSKPTMPPPDTVEKVDLEKYAGKWFEVARLPNSFQKNCFQTTAEYSVKENGNLKVVNKCVKTNGDKKSSSGKAWSVNPPKNSKLKVQFFWPFDGDYWIIGLGQNYEWALVGSPDYEYMWILTRELPIESGLLQEILNLASERGYDTNSLLFDPNLKLR